MWALVMVRHVEVLLRVAEMVVLAVVLSRRTRRMIQVAMRTGLATG